MSFFTLLRHELTLTKRDRSLWLWVLIVFMLSVLSVSFGVFSVQQQHATIKQIKYANHQERESESKKFTGWGSAAYYSFHITYSEPSHFAYAAMGQRDQQPWKHRIRMLALEGQIYERDVGNPSVAVIGRFDFAFLAAFIFPLVLILLLYDIRTSEKTAGRFNLLEATVGTPYKLWLSRAVIRVAAVFIALIVPMILVGIVHGTAISTLLLASASVLAYTVLWAGLCYKAAAWRHTAPSILMGLMGIWLSTSVVIPAGARLVIDNLVPLPTGSDILLTQREAVNDAWDLPRDTTMQAFFERHPQWANYTKQTSSFEWQWYYAFQQVGDQQAEHLSQAYRNGRIKRDNYANWTALLAPASLLERTLQTLAQTSTQASLQYEQSVRDYHNQLREFYYPYFFTHAPFDKKALDHIPSYTP